MQRFCTVARHRRRTGSRTPARARVASAAGAPSTLAHPTKRHSTQTYPCFCDDHSPVRAENAAPSALAPGQPAAASPRSLGRIQGA